MDSSTEACTAGVAVGDQVVTDFEIAPRGHAQLLLPMAESLLERTGVGFDELDLIGFGRGPGSFTGVRIATAMAQGIAMARDLPLAGVSSLDCLALGAWHRYVQGGGTADAEIAVAIDARMGEIYRAVYRVGAGGTLVVVEDEAVTEPTFPPRKDASLPLVVAGSGFGRYPEMAESDSVALHAPDALPHAEEALELLRRTSADDWMSADKAVPHYLRDNVAKVAT
nr:tRNA (adenosine(37)-N6)-threonylcarbamoyltransferase complex dimerization subunit type 1 TsaB [Guyparkeria hydrothermalis]